MEKEILAVNVGSSSKKYALFAGDVPVARAHYEQTASGHELSVDGGAAVSIDAATFANACADFVERVAKSHASSISAVGIRVVAIGSEFAKHERIDTPYERALAAAAEHDPDHTPLVIAEIKQVKKCLPHTTLVAASDSAFHATMPEVAKRYAIPPQLGIEKTGFHGLSVASAVAQVREMLGTVPSRMIVCHLGSGVSVTALKDGATIDTSMGYSPVSGVPMSSRAGDLDAEAVLRLVEESGVANTRQQLYHLSGLQALSGLSDDMRVLLDAEHTNKRTAFAIDAFTYHIRSYIGAYVAALGGLDALVFSGTMGIRAPRIRSKICSGLEQFTIALDERHNERAKSGDVISTGTARVLVLQTDEEREIARVAGDFV